LSAPFVCVRSNPHSSFLPNFDYFVSPFIPNKRFRPPPPPSPPPS
jgi:hypothetical protein